MWGTPSDSTTRSRNRPTSDPTTRSWNRGWVLALEVPYYPAGLGGFNIEEVLLITDDGVEAFNQSRRTLTTLSP